MSKEPTSVNTASSIAPLRNVVLLVELVERVQERSPNLPGMASFFGRSGTGKSCAAMFAANKYRAYHVQVKSVWTRKKLCTSILREMGISVTVNTVADMVDQIGEQLSLSRRPLLIDEADYLVKSGMIEVIRDIYESSQASVILIGEEGLPNALRRWERVHGRMLDWIPAQPASLSDSKHLAKLYCPGVTIDEALLDAAHRKAGGSVRRVCVNLDRIRERAATSGLKAISLKEFEEAEFFDGNPAGRIS
jgi:hypothetical protein